MKSIEKSIKYTNLKKSIVIDFDDTLVKSSEQIIRMICRKYNIHKDISNLKDYYFKSIYKDLDVKEVEEMFASEDFFNEVELNDGVKEFLNRFKEIFNIIICSKGTEKNLKLKEEFCKRVFGKDIKFIGVGFNNKFGCDADKSSIKFENPLFCVEDNTEALVSLNVPFKFLLKNNREVYWNKTPMNEENIYVINDFFDLIEIIDAWKGLGIFEQVS